ncbi:hypothetical protein [Staphylococcus gallinarum]|uniref:hypothetical protein n=1 Tax=Staphylococcus gallinarum TaxID=1293 RepID=UPI001E29797C|nr:hypothetical protein [Staphylococcus gallinarum]MCD8785415.1 hypothetical protein [Staphylococcus gallinarum]MCD8844650.1 hypothetical protein [Staphylococcus gallinarum]
MLTYIEARSLLGHDTHPNPSGVLQTMRSFYMLSLQNKILYKELIETEIIPEVKTRNE